MKKIMINVLISLFTLISQLISQPIIEFEGGSTYDWGTVNFKDSPLKAKVKIHNKGTDTLFIKEVKPGCGCTTAPLDKNTVAPGDFATIDITLNVDGTIGEVNKNIRIFANTANATEFLFLKANVFREIITIGESYFNYGDNIVLGKDYSKIVKIKNNTQKPIKILKIEEKPDYCKLNIEPGSIIPPNEELPINATVNLKSPGLFSFCLKIQTEISDKPDLYISAWGTAK